MAGHYRDRFTGAVATINGAPGLLMEIGNGQSVITVAVDGGLITAIDVMRNPDKLTTLAR
jgi:RNA polymerase sigma-70 factor (ECF subfamily)